MKFDESFSEEGLSSIVKGIKETEEGTLFLEHTNPEHVLDVLKKFWIRKRVISRLNLLLARKEKRIAKPTQDKPIWLIAISNQFTKDIQNIDRKLGGRILTAIGAIYKDPTTPKGDTIKPLSSDLKGFWRYRVGDHRLVYSVDSENQHIILVAFASRGDIYES